MKIDKKSVMIILIIAVLVITALLLFFLSKESNSKYPEEPLRMKSLGKSTLALDISQVKEIKNEDIPIYYINKENHSSDVEDLIDEMSITLVQEPILNTNYIKWSKNGNSLTYDLLRDSIEFQFSTGIPMSIEDNVFSSFYKRYLNLDYSFEILSTDKNKENETTYYGKRLLGEIPLEYGYDYNYSDVLKLNSKGYLIGGELLLAEIEKKELFLPLISKDDLLKYINIEGYPKEHYLNTSVLTGTLEINYLDDAWGEIEKSASNCIADDFEVIFLYKNSDQGYLLPVYQFSSYCDVEYETKSYSVPATFYVNAVDPEYIVYSE